MGRVFDMPGLQYRISLLKIQNIHIYKYINILPNTHNKLCVISQSSRSKYFQVFCTAMKIEFYIIIQTNIFHVNIYDKKD